MIYRVIFLDCDQCGASLDFLLSEERTYAEARNRAAGWGWSRRNKQDWCYECTKERERQDAS